MRGFSVGSREGLQWKQVAKNTEILGGYWVLHGFWDGVGRQAISIIFLKKDEPGRLQSFRTSGYQTWSQPHLKFYPIIPIIPLRTECLHLPKFMC